MFRVAFAYSLREQNMSLLRIAIFLLIVGFAAYGCLDDANRDESGNIVGEGEVSAFSMRVGDCFNDSQEVIDAGGDEVVLEAVAGLPCSEPHDNEVYAVLDLSLERFPGGEEIYDLARDECVERFESFVGVSYEASILDIMHVYPTEESWSRGGDREVICAIYHMEADKTTGSMNDSGI